jgi:hypothetical protein
LGIYFSKAKNHEKGLQPYESGQRNWVHGSTGSSLTWGHWIKYGAIGIELKEWIRDVLIHGVDLKMDGLDLIL